MIGAYPREGTAVRRALDVLGTLPPGADLTTRELADRSGLDVRSIGGQLFYLIARGLIVQTHRPDSGRVAWRLPTAEEQALFVAPQRREEDIATEMLSKFFPPAKLVGQLRDAMWLGSSKTGNPTLALGEVITLASAVLERRRQPTRFVTAEVEAAVAHELASIMKACEMAAMNLKEYLAGLDV